MGMLLIDRGGRRVRKICVECRRIHNEKGCPRRKAVDPVDAARLRFTRKADAVLALLQARTERERELA
jgi:hypothetical protein